MLQLMGSTTRHREKSAQRSPKKVAGGRGNLYSTDSPPNLGAVLRGARAHSGLTLRMVEEKTGIPNGYLSQIEKGHIRKPDPSALWKLADLYRLDFFQLLNWTGHTRERVEQTAVIAKLIFTLLQELRPEDQQKALRSLEELRQERGVTAEAQ